MILYRPVGLAELHLVYEARLAAFPSRLPEQPIFYPVLNAAYATQIARDWNAKSEEAAGYVTRFEIDQDFALRYDIHQVGSREHQELWVPAQDLAAFNEHISPPIVVTDAYFGGGFKGLAPSRFMLAGKNALDQFVALDQILAYSGFDFWCEVAANDVAIFLHYPFWARYDFTVHGVSNARRDHILAAIAERWKEGFADRPLPELRAHAA